MKITSTDKFFSFKNGEIHFMFYYGLGFGAAIGCEDKIFYYEIQLNIVLLCFSFDLYLNINKKEYN